MGHRRRVSLRMRRYVCNTFKSIGYRRHARQSLSFCDYRSTWYTTLYIKNRASRSCQAQERWQETTANGITPWQRDSTCFSEREIVFSQRGTFFLYRRMFFLWTQMFFLWTQMFFFERKCFFYERKCLFFCRNTVRNKVIKRYFQN